MVLNSLVCINITILILKQGMLKHRIHLYFPDNNSSKFEKLLRVNPIQGEVAKFRA